MKIFFLLSINIIKNNINIVLRYNQWHKDFINMYIYTFKTIIKYNFKEILGDCHEKM